MRGETLDAVKIRCHNQHFNPLPSCEGRPCFPLPRFCCRIISIHSPHARGDSQWEDVDVIKVISIHSPHARGDPATSATPSPPYAFQSTPLMRGETVFQLAVFDLHCGFQSTPLMRGETIERGHTTRPRSISIHSPHARGDRKSLKLRLTEKDFNPLPSCEGRPFQRLWN